jgi:hypothetical protein
MRYLYMVGVLLLVYVTIHFGWRSILGPLVSARPGPLSIVCVLLLGGFWVRAWKWGYALGEGKSGVGLFFLSKTAGNFSPGRLGELSPLLLPEHRNARVAAWIVTDRLIEAIFTLFLGLAGVYALGLLSGTMTAGLGAGGIVGVIVGVWVLIRVRAPFLPEQAGPGGRSRFLRLFGNMQLEVRLLGRRMPIILATTVMGKMFDIWAIIWLCHAFGYEVSFLLVCAARCAHALVSGIPITPDATGVPFVAAAFVLHEKGGIPYPILTAALGAHLILINGLLSFSFLLAARDLRSNPS